VEGKVSVDALLLDFQSLPFLDILNYYQGSPSHNRPGIPIRLEGLLDSARKLLARRQEMEPALAGLSRTYKIGSYRGPARDFLFGPSDEASPDRFQAGLSQVVSVLQNVEAEGSAEKAFFALLRVFAGDVFRLEAETSQMTKMPLQSFDQFDISLTEFDQTFADAKQFVPQWTGTLSDAQKASAAFWPNFAENGLAYNLLILEKVRAANQVRLKTLFGNAWNAEWDNLVAAGQLYAIDLSLFCRFPSTQVDGLMRFTPGTITLLRQDSVTKELTPIAVRVASFQEKKLRIFVRGQVPDDHWLYALQAAKTSVTVYGIWLGHVYHWHIVTAAALKAMLSNLGSTHPVYQILRPQSDFLMQFDEILLLIWKFLAPPTSFASKESFLQLIDAFAENRNFFDDDPQATLTRMGISKADFSVHSDWDRFPIVKTYLECFASASTYVNTVVDSFALRDADIAGDSEIQGWINETTRPHAGNLRGIGAIDTVASLKAVLTSLVYRTTMHGCSRLRKSLSPVLSFVGNYPVCLQSDSIPVQGESIELLQYLPYTGTIGLMTRFYGIFLYTEPYVPLIPKAGVSEDLYYPADPTIVRNGALIKFRQSVLALMQEIQPLRSQPHQWPRGIET